MTQGQEGEASSRRVGRAGRGGQELPRDRFDDLPPRKRVGAHRLVARPRRAWVYLVSGLIAVAVLTGAGIATVMVAGSNVTRFMEEWREQPRETREVQTAAELDPTAEIVVLNGTSMQGFGTIVDDLITQNEWGTILFSAEAATNDVSLSAVFYSDPADEAAALGLARELGGVSVFQSDNYSQYGARLVVLLGADYAGPGSEQFVAGGSVSLGEEEGQQPEEGSVDDGVEGGYEGEVATDEWAEAPAEG